MYKHFSFISTIYVTFLLSIFVPRRYQRKERWVVQNLFSFFVIHLCAKRDTKKCCKEHESMCSRWSCY